MHVTDNNTDLKDHQATLCEKADRAIGLAIELRHVLRNNPNLPLPEQETDDLIRALAVFCAAAASYPR